jgi:hypothetical protein
MKLLSVAAIAVALATAAGCSRTQPAVVEQAVAPVTQTAAIAPPPKPAPAYFRDHYAGLDDCVHDWGYPQKCTPVVPGSPAAVAGAAFLGPVYARTYREETQVQLRREALDGGYVQRVAEGASDRSIAKSEVKS